MKHAFTLICIIFFAIACKRKGEPVPEICSSKPSYVLTDTIRVENCSKRFTKQRWVLPDGTQSSGNYVYYVPTTSGVFTFKLYVSNEDFVNEYEAIRNITVHP